MSHKRTDASAIKESSASTLRQRTDSWPIRSQALVSVWSSPQDLSDFLSSAESKTWKLDIYETKKICSRRFLLCPSITERRAMSGVVRCCWLHSWWICTRLGRSAHRGPDSKWSTTSCSSKKKKNKSNQFPRGKFLRLWVWKTTTTIILFLLSSKWKVSTWLVSLQYFDGEGACGIKLLTFQLYYPSTRWYTLCSTNVTFVEFFLCTFTTDNTTVHRTGRYCVNRAVLTAGAGTGCVLEHDFYSSHCRNRGRDGRHHTKKKQHRSNISAKPFVLSFSKMFVCSWESQTYTLPGSVRFTGIIYEICEEKKNKC